MMEVILTKLLNPITMVIFTASKINPTSSSILPKDPSISKPIVWLKALEQAMLPSI